MNLSEVWVVLSIWVILTLCGTSLVASLGGESKCSGKEGQRARPPPPTNYMIAEMRDAFREGQCNLTAGCVLRFGAFMEFSWAYRTLYATR